MTRKRLLLGGGATFAALVIVAGFAFWWFLIRDDSPPPVSISDAVDALNDETPTATAGGDNGEDGEPTATAPPEETVAPVELDGTWTLSSQGESFVGYRVREELASIGFKTAVGRTPTVDATVVIEGDQVVSTTIVANMQDLDSDDSRRDGQLQRQAIETNTFPTSTFELTEPITLPEGLTTGEVVEVTATGNLTLHGVTREVEVPMEATVVGEIIIVIGSLPILFADYDIERPTSAAVLSVEDNGIMELQINLIRTR